MRKPVTIQSPLEPLTLCPSSIWTRSMSRNVPIEAVSLVGRMLYNNALARNVTLALGSCTHDNPVKTRFCCLCFLQAVIPLSYAAQIPTTPLRYLANVRLSVWNVDHQVPQSSACVRACVRACCECVFVLVCVSEKLCLIVC